MLQVEIQGQVSGQVIANIAMCFKQFSCMVVDNPSQMPSLFPSQFSIMSSIQISRWCDSLEGDSVDAKAETSEKTEKV